MQNAEFQSRKHTTSTKRSWMRSRLQGKDRDILEDINAKPVTYGDDHERQSCAGTDRDEARAAKARTSAC